MISFGLKVLICEMMESGSTSPYLQHVSCINKSIILFSNLFYSALFNTTWVWASVPLCWSLYHKLACVYMCVCACLWQCYWQTVACIWFCWEMVMQSSVKSTGQRAPSLIKVPPSEKLGSTYLSSNDHSYLSLCACVKWHIWHVCRWGCRAVITCTKDFWPCVCVNPFGSKLEWYKSF